ncbi:MAG: PDZ domain-containing protein, partial [Armatimonadetes bacterium]|nr:PDZ domain-containing protein [Armatimonadota bacterium]
MTRITGKVAGLLAVAVALAAIPVARGAAPEPESVAAVFAAYQIVTEKALRPGEPHALLAGALAGVKKILAERGVSTLPMERAPDARPMDATAFAERFRWAVFASGTRVSPAALAAAAIRGMLAALDDPHAAHISAREYQRQLQASRGEAYGGIGATVGLEGARTVIVSVQAGSPAQRVGLQTGDIIVEIDRRATGTDVGAVSEALRGAPSTTVDLLVVRPGAGPPRQVAVRRELIREVPVSTLVMAGGVGYIGIASFHDSMVALFAQAVTAMVRSGVRGRVLDLRNNPGGSVFAALTVASVFLDKGPVVYVQSRSGAPIPYPVIPPKERPRLPLIVLVNGGTASAAEIVAGALQDAGVPLMGTVTFGKA